MTVFAGDSLRGMMTQSRTGLALSPSSLSGWAKSHDGQCQARSDKQ